MAFVKDDRIIFSGHTLARFYRQTSSVTESNTTEAYIAWHYLMMAEAPPD